MKLPSGNEISKETLVEMCETIIGEKLLWECTYGEAFETTEESLREGQYVGIPALDEDDIHFLFEALKHVVVDCETALRKTLGTFMADNTVVNSW